MSRYLLAMAVGLSALAAGCEKQEPQKVTARQVEQKTAEAAGAAADYARQEKDECVARAQKAVDEARAEIDRLKAQADKARADGKASLGHRIETLEARRKLAEQKLGELKSASGEAWKDLESGVDKAIEYLKHPDQSRRAP